jgi:hypothetical protein
VVVGAEIVGPVREQPVKSGVFVRALGPVGEVLVEEHLPEDA